MVNTDLLFKLTVLKILLLSIKSTLYTGGSKKMFLWSIQIYSILTVPKKIWLWSIQIFSLYWWFPRRFYCDPYKTTLYTVSSQVFIMVQTNLLFILMVPKKMLLWSIQNYSLYWCFQIFYYGPNKSTLCTDGSQEDFIVVHTNLISLLMFIVIHTNLLSLLVVPKKFYYGPYESTIYTDSSQADFIVSIQIYSLYWWFPRRFYCDQYKSTLYTDVSDFIVIHSNLLSILMVPKKILLWSIKIYSLY